MAWIDSTLSLALNLSTIPCQIPNKIPTKKAENLAEELNRLSGENKKLTGMLTAMNESYSALQAQFAELMHRSSSVTKRKSIDGSEGVQSSSSSDDDSKALKRPRESSYCGGVVRRTPSSTVLVRVDKSETTLNVKDGYQWRKYGQKVTRDNPSPRAYFKCSFAPSCQVKKKVQRSADDQTMLVATYDGEHNHLPPSDIEASSQRNVNLSSSRLKHRVTLDLITPVEETRLNRKGSGGADGKNRREFQQFTVEQMASSLSKDPGFKAAVAAISGKVMMNSYNDVVGKWV